MAIFSRTKRSSKAIEEYQVAPITEPTEILPPSPSRPAPLLPIDRTKPAVILTAEEVRARIAANRKRQSDIIRRSAALSYTHSRTVSEYSLPGSRWQTHRLREPTSIETILRDMPTHDAELLPPPLVMRGRDSVRRESEHTLSRRHSEEDIHAYSNPRAVPLPPPIRTQASPPPRSRSRQLIKTKPSNPLSTGFMQQDEDYFSTSSRDSARNSASTTNSVASSATSTSSIFNEGTKTKRTSVKIPNFSKPTLASKREKPALEISLPYSSNAEGMEEEVKTAKSLIPTWRYEDLRTDNELPMTVTTIPPTHTRNKSWGHSRKSSFSVFRRKNLSTTAF